MPSTSKNRLRLLLLVSVLLASMAALSGVARAEFGEIARFGKLGTGAENLGFEQEEKKSKLVVQTQMLLGVDPETNDVYVLEEPRLEYQEHKETYVREFVLKEYGPNGEFIAESNPKQGERIKDETPLDEGEEEGSTEGIAVDPKRGRVYFLVNDPRETESKVDKEALVATRLYAYSTKPESGKLVPAAETSKTEPGVLADPEQLGSFSETAGKALLAPHGITVDPETGEVIILAHIDPKGEERDLNIVTGGLPEKDRYVLQRVGTKGELKEQYVDKKNFLRSGPSYVVPVSPVVDSAVTPERVYVSYEGVVQIPQHFAEATTKEEAPTQLFKEGTLSLKKILYDEFEYEHFENGGSMSISPEGKLFSLAEVENELASETAEAGVFEQSGADGSPIGWTGGQANSIEAKEDKCVVSPGIHEDQTLVAAGKEGKVFVLSPEFLEREKTFASKSAVIEFGEGAAPGKGGCPKAETVSGEPIAVTVGGKALGQSTPVKAGTEAKLSSVVKQADALSSTWEFENEETKKLEETKTITEDQYVKTELAHKFSVPGKFKITEKIHTDDLATPELTATRKITVEPSEEIQEFHEEPKNATVLAGSTATFTESATGSPAIQWFEWTKGGTPPAKCSEYEKDTTDLGRTQATLKVEKTTPAESGNEYCVVLTYPKTTLESKAAKLTVTTEAPVVQTQPQNTSVEEGSGATFTSSAKGAPAPTVQWEVSTNGGASFGAISGATATTLNVSATTTSESGNEYRAAFSNGVGSPVKSNPATLTVAARKPPPPPPPPCGSACEGGSTTTTSTTSTTGPGGGVQGFTAVPPAATIAGLAISVSKSGVATLKVSCPANSTSCTGTIVLKTVSAVVARASAAKVKKAILTLGTGSFSIPAGQTKTVTVHLSATARKLVGKSHALRARVTVTAHNPAGEKNTAVTVITLRAAKR